MSGETAPIQLALPFVEIFDDETEAHWGFDFLHHTLDLLGGDVNQYRPSVMTLPKGHKLRVLRFNFGPWLLIDYCGPTSHFSKHIHLALITDDMAVDPRKKWLSFNYPHDKRGVSIYRFRWQEIKKMDAKLTAHYEESMLYTGELIGYWKGSPYRLAHQPQVFAAIFDPTVRADLFRFGLDPMFVHRMNQDE